MNVIIPTPTEAYQAFQKAFPGFKISEFKEDVPSRVWTATVSTEHVTERAFARFTQKSGWFVDTSKHI